MVFQVFKLYDLPWLGKQHTAVIMVIFGTSVHNDPGFKLLKPDNVKVSGKRLFTKRGIFRAPINAEQRILRHRQVIKTVQISQTVKMLHDLKFKQVRTNI